MVGINSTTTSATTFVNLAEDAELRLIQVLCSKDKTLQQECEKYINDGKFGLLVDKIITHSDKTLAASLLSVDDVVDDDEATGAFSLFVSLIVTRVADAKQQSQFTQELARAIVDAKPAAANKGTVARKIQFLSIIYNMRSDGGTADAAAAANERCLLLRQMISLAASDPATTYMLLPDQPLGHLLLPPDIDDADAAAAVVSSASNTAKKTASTGLVPCKPRIVTMLDAWSSSGAAGGVTIENRRNLYETIVKALSSTDDDVRKQQFLLLLVESYEKPQPIDQLGYVAAKQAALGTIQDPVTLFSQQRNVLAMQPIQALQAYGDSTDPAAAASVATKAAIGSRPDIKLLYGLLRIIQQGKLCDYLSYVKDNGGPAKVLTPSGLDDAACQRYMRILSLCSLANEHDEEIPYEVIADTLHLTQDGEDGMMVHEQVESWVIATVSTGLLEAKMDQLRRRVIVERVVIRPQFGTGPDGGIQQWQSLQKKLHSWKGNVGQILQALEQTQLATSSANTTNAAKTSGHGK